jgi:hypothetical protein
MRFLLVHAFFDFVPGGDVAQAKVEEITLGAPSPALSPDVRQLCATRLFGLLADALAAAQATIRPGGQAEPAAAEVAAAEATARKQRAVECAANLEPLLEVCAKAERAHALVGLAQPLQAEAAAVRKAVRALLPALDRLATADSAAARSDACVQAESARALLRVLLLLQLSAPQDYTPDMEDLPRCLQAACGLASAAAEAAEDGAEPPHHMDVLVEVLLSLLAKPSAVLRDVVERVFRAFAASITPEGVRSMLRVVTRSKGRRHSSAKDGSDDSDDEDSDDEDSDEEEEEVEEDGGGDDEDDDEEEEDDDEEDAAPRKAQPPKAARDAVVDDDGEDSDDGAGMEDDAMFKADAALAAVLSLSKAEKSKKKAAAEALTHFKFRVLSLLEMFIKAQPASPLLPVRTRVPAVARHRRCVLASEACCLTLLRCDTRAALPRPWCCRCCVRSSLSCRALHPAACFPSASRACWSRACARRRPRPPPGVRASCLWSSCSRLLPSACGTPRAALCPRWPRRPWRHASTCSACLRAAAQRARQPCRRWRAPRWATTSRRRSAGCRTPSSPSCWSASRRAAVRVSPHDARFGSLLIVIVMLTSARVCARRRAGGGCHRAHHHSAREGRAQRA